MNEEQRKIADRIANRLSDEAIEAYHNGKEHPQLTELFTTYPEGFQIWGSRTGKEPLKITYPA